MKAFYILILLSVFSLKSFAQQKPTEEKIRTFYYTFSGIGSVAEAQKLDAEILKIQNIKSCKTKVKPEKRAGELYIKYNQPVFQSEKEAKNSVDIEEVLKKKLIENGYAPNELKEIK